MFARLGSFAVRFRWFIIAAWVLVAVVLTLVAPNINDVAVSDQRAFLPASAPSLDANEVVKKYFPDRVSPSSAVVVVDAGAGNRADQGAAAEFVDDLTSWLTGPDKPAGVDQVLSPTLGRRADQGEPHQPRQAGGAGADALQRRRAPSRPPRTPSLPSRSG